jgi:branched-chain amino acid transport system permease protein
MAFIEFLVFGTVLGFILALLSMGYSLVYGVGGITNLAHGAFYMLTGYIIFWMADPLYGAGIPYTIAIILGLVIITMLGVIIYYALIKPANHNEILIMIITFALAFFLEQFVTFIESLRPDMIRAIHLEPLIKGGVEIFGIIFSYQNLVVVIGAFFVIVFTLLFINKSKLGKSIRAVSQDREAAELMGINVDKTLVVTLMISALLAGIAAVLYVPEVDIYPFSGWDFLLMSMSVVILGGLGSITGSVLGAFIISFSRLFTFYYIDAVFGVAFYGVIHLIVIIFVLLIRPQGLFGKKERS